MVMMNPPFRSSLFSWGKKTKRVLWRFHCFTHPGPSGLFQPGSISLLTPSSDAWSRSPCSPRGKSKVFFLWVFSKRCVFPRSLFHEFCPCSGFYPCASLLARSIFDLCSGASFRPEPPTPTARTAARLWE